MSWLLRWAGMKERRPWWDRWLLIAAAMLVVFCFAAMMLIAGNDPWTRFQWTGIGAGYIAILIVLHFASGRIEKRLLKQTIERCRRGPTFRHIRP
jgi:peptidoglycan/LPS O-acetylase OafA/YrhL